MSSESMRRPSMSKRQARMGGKLGGMWLVGFVSEGHIGRQHTLSLGAPCL